MFSKGFAKPHHIFMIQVVFFILALSLGISCQVAGLGAQPTETQAPTATSTPTLTSTATETPTPTNTLVPTDTPTPTATNTLAPTPTKDRTATAVARETEVAEVVIAEIQDALERVDYPTDTGSLGWYQTETVFLKMDEPEQGFYREFAEDLVAADFAIETNITWEASGLIVCGLMFRSEADFKTGAQYQFNFLRLSGLPAWAIEYFDNGEFKYTITDIRFADAINLDNGAKNTFLIIAEGNKFTVYVNDARLGSFYDDGKRRAEGRFAYVSSQDAGKSTCKFEDTWIWLLK
jgi:hypothetical protein